MYDTERIRCAKMFLDLLSEGVDPITNEDVTENTLKTPEVIACLKYVSEILAEKIDISVQKISDKSKSEFFITEEQKRQLNPISDMINVSSITAEINRITANNECRKLKAVSVNDWLESIGLLRVSELGSRTATESGNDIGIKSELRTSNEGRMYYANSYNEDAQRFIYENISVIANFVSEGNESVSKTKRVRRYELTELKSGTSIGTYIKEHQEVCYIMAIGSIDSLSGIGTYKSLLIYKGHKKVFAKSGVKSHSNANIVLNGIKEAAEAIKSPVDVVIITQKKTGFGKRYNKEFKICNEISEILSSIGCNITVCECSYRESELEGFFF